MGGWGSTRWWGYTAKMNTDQAYHFSASDLKRLGLLPLPEGVDSRYQSLAFWRGSEKTGSLGIHVQKKLSTDYQIKLEYRASIYGGTGVNQSVVITVEKLDRPNRYFFRCPSCDKRVGTLYLPYNAYRFACRHCHDLVYASSQNWRKPPRALEGWYRDFREMEKIFKQLERLKKESLGV